MATSIFSPGTFSTFSNVSTTAPVTSCQACDAAYIYVVHGSWTQNTTLPALRTLQPVINPVDNTTSTSVSCNPGVVPDEYQTGLCDTLKLGDDCNLMCEVVFDQKGPFNLTLSRDNGNFVAFEDEIKFWGQVSTTDSAGALTCLSERAFLPEPSFVYYGPTARTTVTTAGATTEDVFMVMPELTDYYPKEALFQQCSYYRTGPPAIALTAANEIILPATTLPRPSTAPEPTPVDPPPTPTTTPRPAGTPTPTPSRTSRSQTAAPAPSPSPEEPEDPENTLPQDDSPESPPGNLETPPEQSGLPEQPKEQPEEQSLENPTRRPESPNGDSATAEQPAPSDIATASRPVGSDNDDPSVTRPGDGNPSVIVIGDSTTTITRGQAPVISGTTFSLLPSNGGVEAVADGVTRTLPRPGRTEVGVARPDTTDAPGFALPGLTITAGGEEVVISGMTYSALPSGLGVVAIGEAGSTTLEGAQLAASGFNTVPQNPDAYVLPSQTLEVGGSAAVISGTTYTALPRDSTIDAAGSDQSGLVAVTEATSIPGIGQISAVDNLADGYVVDGSITVAPGGAAVKISGTVYSALPSGLGVLVGSSSDADEFASYIAQGVSGAEPQRGADGSDNYIIGIDPDSNDPVTVSGVVYSVLPSGSGVLVVANSESTTVALSPTATVDSSGPDATESVVAFAGIAAGMESLIWGGYLVLLGVVGTCLLVENLP